MKVRTLYPAVLLLALGGQSCAPDSPAPDKTVPAAPGQQSALIQAARQPLTVSPLVWLYAQKLVASDGAAGNLFGKSAALSGDVIALGAPEALVSGKSYAGAAYVFARSGATWTEQAKLSASDVAANTEFGLAIAAAGDTVVVGAPQASAGAVMNSGAAYVYVRSGTTWTEQAKLAAADATSNSQFGRAVAIAGDTILIGAPYTASGTKLAAGAAYVFVRSGTTWMQQTKLVAADAAATDLYGTAVALAGDTAVCGAIGASRGADADAGAAYVYVRSGTTWSQQDKLAVATTGFFGGFGSALALDGDTLTVGTKDSSAYVYVRSGTTWSQQLEARPLAYTFGSSTAVGGNTALFGAPDRDAGAGFQPGRVHIYTRSGTTWSAVTQRSAVDGTPGDLFGTALALGGDWLVVAAPEADLGAASNAGAAYVFRLGMDRANGQSCVADAECTSGNCIDAVCCDTTCGYGSSNDCQACSVAAGAAVDGTCGAVKSGVVCRVAADLCDAAETCTGAGTSCPADKFLPSGTTCRAAAGVCDTAETCSGTSRSCPSDTFKSSATQCRAAAGLCDRAEYCTGAAAACPSDTFQPFLTVCRAVAGACDVAERCSGFSIDCPADSVAGAGTACRAAAGPCDVAESCTGTSSDCPADSFQPSTFTCRASAKDCDAPETCTGKSPSCPSDQQAADGAMCSVGVCARGACQPEAELQVALTADPLTVHGAQPVLFTAQVKNNGRGEATATALTLAYPPTAALAQLGGPGWGCQSAAGGAACTLDKLAAGGSATLTMQLIAPAELALFNVSAQAKAATPDPVPENNFVTVLIRNDRLGPGPLLPDLGASTPDLSHLGPATEPGGGCSYGRTEPRRGAPLDALLALLAVAWLSTGAARRARGPASRSRCVASSGSGGRLFRRLAMQRENP